tara:strand:- start:198 stop:695 length:498 start_codon:yes stop_codon:yes gene_type:complete
MTQSRDPTDILLGILSGIKSTVIALKGITESLGDIQSLLEGGGEKVSQPQSPATPVLPVEPEKPKNDILSIFDVPSVASSVPVAQGTTTESRHFNICQQNGLISELPPDAIPKDGKKYICNVPGCSRSATTRFRTLGYHSGDKSGQWKGVIGHIGRFHKAYLLKQ